MVFLDFHVAGSLREGESLARFSQYGGGGTPTVWVDGLERLSGSNDVASRYQNAFAAAEADSAHLSLAIDTGYDSPSGTTTISVTVEIAEAVADYEDCVVQIVVMEDEVTSRGNSFDRTVRQILDPVPLTVGAAGERQTVLRTVDLGTGWQPVNLSAVAWVHRASTGSGSSQEVLNAVQSQSFGTTPIVKMSWGGVKAAYR